MFRHDVPKFKCSKDAPLSSSEAFKHEFVISDDIALQKIPQFHVISWCGNFVERHSFRIVSCNSICLSTKFPHQEIR